MRKEAVKGNLPAFAWKESGKPFRGGKSSVDPTVIRIPISPSLTRDTVQPLKRVASLRLIAYGHHCKCLLSKSNGLVIVADLPEEWVVERLADMLGEVYAEEHPQLTSRGSALQPRPAFTYHFPQQDEASSFAVRPSDPRYYQEVRALPDIVTVPDLEVAKEPEEPQTTTTTTTTLAPELSERDQDTESGVSRSLIPATIDDTEDIYFIASGRVIRGVEEGQWTVKQKYYWMARPAADLLVRDESTFSRDAGENPRGRRQEQLLLAAIELKRSVRRDIIRLLFHDAV
uniref:Uncharacterized protein n=1 Tax=Timema tahoe TaxID=61484 RepID=A0A7R9ID30_9NEOP|nr:unnamed protein product [Timema tahoe]